MFDEKGELTFQGDFRDDLPLQKFTYWKNEDEKLLKKNAKLITMLDINLSKI